MKRGGIVLAHHDAWALHRWLEFQMDGRKWFNPIEAMEAQKAATGAKKRLCEKLVASLEPDPPKGESR